jgi:hypothetical protein
MFEAPVKETSDRLTTMMWLLVYTYAAVVGIIAWFDLTTRYTVPGLHRNFENAYDAPSGIVVDPRPGALGDELLKRYGRRPRRAEFTASGLGDGRHPRLVKVGDAVWLVVGRYGARHVVFDPALGVVLLREGVVGNVPAMDLDNLRERPW